MPMRFSHSHEVRELRLRKHHGVDPEQQKRTELTIAEGLTNLTKNLKQKNAR